jgi:hypothetical protein
VPTLFFTDYISHRFTVSIPVIYDACELDRNGFCIR